VEPAPTNNSNNFCVFYDPVDAINTAKSYMTWSKEFWFCGNPKFAYFMVLPRLHMKYLSIIPTQIMKLTSFYPRSKIHQQKVNLDEIEPHGTGSTIKRMTNLAKPHASFK
jgi:hypothetical protein